MAPLTSQQALQLAFEFALTAENMRSSDGADVQIAVDLYETASRVAFLKAGVIARDEEVRPVFGQTLRPAAFAQA
jgi:hypothetical protein